MVSAKLLSSHLVLELEVHRAGSWDGMGKEGGIKWENKGKVEPTSLVLCQSLTASSIYDVDDVGVKQETPVSLVSRANPPGPKVREADGGSKGGWGIAAPHQ